jgi:chromosome segregation ATPase
MKLRLLFFLIFALSLGLIAQVQQQQTQTRYSVDDVMKKLETMDNSLKEKVDALRNEFDQKLNQSVNQVRDELSLKIEKVDSKVSSISSQTEQVSKRISQISAQNRELRDRISRVEEKVSGVESGIGDVKKSVADVDAGVKEMSAKIDENSSKFDQILSKLGSNRAVFIVGIVILIILSAGIAVGVMNLSKLTKSVERNILDGFESSAGKIEVTTNDLKTIVDVLKQQTSEIVAYQRILEERIISAQQQIEAKLEEKLATRRGRTRKTSSSSEE